MTSQGATIYPNDELLTTTQAARELGVHRLTVMLRCYRGEIPYRQVPGRMLIRRVDLDAVKASASARAPKGAPTTGGQDA